PDRRSPRAAAPDPARTGACPRCSADSASTAASAAGGTPWCAAGTAGGGSPAAEGCDARRRTGTGSRAPAPRPARCTCSRWEQSRLPLSFPSVEHKAAVDRHQLPRDEARAGPQQVDHKPGDVLRLLRTLHGAAGDVVLLAFLRDV